MPAVWSEKGFYSAEIETDGQAGERQVAYQFHPVVGRSFRTINVNLEAEDADPTTTVLRAIKPGGEGKVADAIVRLQISMPAEVEGQLRDNEIRDTLKEAYYSTIAKDIRRETRLRLGEKPAEEIPPLEALKTYLETNFPPDRAKLLLEYGEKLIQERGGQKNV